MKNILLIIGTSLLFAFSNREDKYQIIIKTSEYPIEDYWRIFGIKLNGNDVELLDYESINKTTDKIKVNESGKYQFVFQSIFGDLIIKDANVGKKNSVAEIEYPKFENQVSKYSEIKSSIFDDANRIKIAKVSLGCFGVYDSSFIISKKKNGGIVKTKSVNGEDKEIILSQSEYANLINTLKFEKKDKPRWGSTNRNYLYFKIGEEIITAKEKNFQMKSLEFQLREIKKKSRLE